MCKLGLLTYIEYIVPWLLMPWRLTAPGHHQPWYSIFVLVFGHFRFSEFRLYWWIRVLDSVKCPSFLTNYKAFSATKTPWVELCFGSVGEKIGIKILNSQWLFAVRFMILHFCVVRKHKISVICYPLNVDPAWPVTVCSTVYDSSFLCC